MKQALPFQIKGIDFLDRGGILLADQPRLGKTFQTLNAIAHRESRRPALVLCPSAVTGVWAAEALDLNPEARVLRLHSGNIDRLTETWDIVTVSHDLPGRTPAVARALRELTYDIMVGDECHYWQEGTSLRTQTALLSSQALIRRAGRTILLSGTPTPTHVGNLWPFLYATAPHRIAGRERKDFEERYCKFKMRELPNGKRIRVPSGNNVRAVSELKLLLGAGDVPWWLRRRRDQVLTDLPPKYPPRTIYLSSDKLETYDEFAKTLEGRELVKALRDRNIRYLLRPENKSNLSRLRRLIGEAKAKASVEYIRHVLDNENPRGVVVWAWHPSVLDLIAEEFPAGSYARIDGSTSETGKTEAYTRFQREGGPMLFLGQIKAAGTGIPLHKADRAIFVERSWVPSDNQQAEDRIEGIAQKYPTQVEKLLLDGSTDDLLESANSRREDEWAHLEEGALEEGEDLSWLE